MAPTHVFLRLEVSQQFSFQFDWVLDALLTLKLQHSFRIPLHALPDVAFDLLFVVLCLLFFTHCIVAFLLVVMA